MSQEKNTHKRRTNWGKFLIILSFLLWGSISILPFLEIPNRIFIGGVMYALSYIVFFVGSYLIGTDQLKSWKEQIKKRLKPSVPK